MLVEILVSLVAVTIYILFNTYYVKVSESEIVADIKCEFRFIHISDIHGTTNFFNGRLFSIINKLSPDFVVVTGDLSNRRKQLPRVLNSLAKISAKCGIFIVLGNYEGQEIRFFLKKNTDINESINLIREFKDLTLLMNEYSLIDVNGNKVLLFGFDNSTYGKEEYIKEVDLLEFDYKMILAHSPNIIRVIDDNKIDCNQILVGHTHGGQIKLFKKNYFSMYKDFHIGIKKSKDRLFCINRGLGTVKIPFRINCFPEISLYRVKPCK